jgi:hypothetical protein
MLLPVQMSEATLNSLAQLASTVEEPVVAETSQSLQSLPAKETSRKPAFKKTMHHAHKLKPKKAGKRNSSHDQNRQGESSDGDFYVYQH